MTQDTPKVLIVDDDATLSKGFEFWLKDDYDVSVENNGTNGLEAMSEDIDVVLLDREMPDMMGEDVLKELRDRGYTCGVAMVTGVEPDFDILNMGFDEYLVKPVTKNNLRNVVKKLLKLQEEDSEVKEANSASVKAERLQEQKSDSELGENSDYASLREKLEDLDEELSDYDQVE